MSNNEEIKIRKMIEVNEDTEKLGEGIVKKGGINARPSTPRPAEPPKGQGSNNNQATGKK